MSINESSQLKSKGTSEIAGTVKIKVPAITTDKNEEDIIPTVVSYFKLTPSAVSGKKWQTVLEPTGEDEKAIAVPALKCKFKSKATETKKQQALRPYQKAVLIVELDKSGTESWQFYGNGIVFIEEPSETQVRVQTEIKNQGTRLVLTIDNVADNVTNAQLKFRYVASCIDSAQGAAEMKVYNSQDPVIIIDRPQL